MTRLFQELMPSQNGRTDGSANDFIAEASKQGFKMNVSDFFRFYRMIRGKDMGAVVQELRSSGAIDDKTFEYLKQKAQGFLNLIRMVIGK